MANWIVKLYTNRKTKHRGFKDIQLQADTTLQLLVLIFVLIFRLTLFLQRLLQYKTSFTLTKTGQYIHHVVTSQTIGTGWPSFTNCSCISKSVSDVTKQIKYSWHRFKLIYIPWTSLMNFTILLYNCYQYFFNLSFT